MRRAVIASVLALSAVPAFALDNLLINGGFEDPVVVGVDAGVYRGYDHRNGNELTGWTTYSTYRGTVHFNTDYDPVIQGSQAVQVEVPGDWISQSFPTVIGQTYTLSFDLSAYSAYGGPGLGFHPCPCASILEVTVGPVSATVDGSSAGYVRHTLNFTADSSVTTLKFQNPAVPAAFGNYPQIDNVAVVNAFSISLTGRDLLTYPGVSFPNGMPTLVGDSLVFGPNIPFAKLMVLPLTPPGSAPTTVIVSVNFTRLTSDWDPFVLLSDGAQMLGASIGDNFNGNSGAQDVNDLGSVGSLNMSTVIFSNAGFPNIGEAVEAHFLFNLGSESTSMEVSFNNSSGSFAFAKALSFASGLSLVLMRDNETHEQIQLNSLSFSVLPAATTVVIDIKPGSFPNSINLKSKGVVPVAVLSSPAFNVVDVDVNTVLFAGASPEKFAYEDVNGDGVSDLILHFRTQDLQLSPDSTEATLTANLNLPSGGTISGTDSVQIVPKNDKGDKDKPDKKKDKADKE